MVISDYELVVRLQKGDIDAFDLIYDRYSGKLYVFSMKYLRSSSEAEELVQSVFLKLWENRKLLKKESSFKSYLFTIAYNDICNLFRKRYFHKKFTNDLIGENPYSSFEIEAGIDYRSVIDHIQKIVDKLPEKQRIIFQKSRIEEKSTKEIAAELGLSPGTVDNYISDILKYIRKHLGNENIALMLFFWLFIL